jgi:hypothetical protein
MYVCEKILSTFSPSFSVVVVVNSCISFDLNISVDAFLSAASVEKKTSYSYKKNWQHRRTKVVVLLVSGEKSLG